MGSSFNPQILVEKLIKLNNSQQSIETLSHWCIFHMNKAKQVVETWARQFHCSPREQRLAFLYLANDILQNSRRKGLEFVDEFWKVLPDALRDVTKNGDEFGRNAAQRLISIWEERKVFGSQGRILKEELIGRHLENSSSRDGKHLGFKLKNSAGNALGNIVSGYQIVYGGQLDEDAILSKCRNAISCVEKVHKEIGGRKRTNSGQLDGSGLVDELQEQHTILKNCREQLRAVETSRANLVSHLREALQEQEFKLDQVRSQLQAAQFQSEQAGNMCSRLLNCNKVHELVEQSMENCTSEASHSFIAGNGEQSASLMSTRQVPFSKNSSSIEGVPISAAASVAAKLTASTSSAQMLSYVLSSLASEGVIGNSIKEYSSGYPSEKRPKFENPQPPVQPFPHPESLQQNVCVTDQESNSHEQPPLQSSRPSVPPVSPMQSSLVPQFMQTAGPTTSVSINGVSRFAAPSTNPYHSFQGSEGVFYSQQSSLPMAPIYRQ
ncbi:uncharacterized protein LOC132315629 [Cornus florida]|uniref:uncharacterized protein LOC132315629 n=1 Tax=Cornus florida TaxID=4283 RepID=UPI002896B8E8|nr:uncharacterized protein LOC132315629 [Cornus florida]